MKAILCPCNSGKKYKVCCGPYHKGNIHAPTAEALMRSRYSAYVVKDAQYIYRTWDKNTRPPLSVLREDNSQLFTELKIINRSKGNLNDAIGTVEFIASYINQDSVTSDNISTDNQQTVSHHHENSYFSKHKNQWKYVNELSKIDIDESFENKT